MRWTRTLVQAVELEKRPFIDRRISATTCRSKTFVKPSTANGAKGGGSAKIETAPITSSEQRIISVTQRVPLTLLRRAGQGLFDERRDSANGLPKKLTCRLSVGNQMAEMTRPQGKHITARCREIRIGDDPADAGSRPSPTRWHGDGETPDISLSLAVKETRSFRRRRRSSIR